MILKGEDNFSGTKNKVWDTFNGGHECMRTVSQGSRYSRAEIDDTKILNSILRLSLGRILSILISKLKLKPRIQKVFSTEMEKEASKVTPRY